MGTAKVQRLTSEVRLRRRRTTRTFAFNIRIVRNRNEHTRCFFPVIGGPPNAPRLRKRVIRPSSSSQTNGSRSQNIGGLWLPPPATKWYLGLIRLTISETDSASSDGGGYIAAGSAAEENAVTCVGNELVSSISTN